jgi:riboflavin-specific deaminase-like protein
MSEGTHVMSRPMVTLKLAQTLDGRIATSSGHSRWVSGHEARVLAHELRADHDAVLVGIGTVLLDDPQLTTRLAPGKNPIRVVLDTTLRLPAQAALLAAGAGDVVVVTSPAASADAVSALQARGAEVAPVNPADSGLDLHAVLDVLGERGIRTVLVEGGRAVATSFLRADLVDRLVVIVAPKLLGDGINAIGDLGSGTMADARLLEGVTVEMRGLDMVVRAHLTGHVTG